MDSPHKGPIMLSFDVTFVYSKTTLEFPVIWDAMSFTQRHCDVIFTQHRHICIVKWKQFWIKSSKYVHLYSKLCKMQLVVMFL